MITTNGKIIVVDWGCLMFTAIFSQKYTPQIPLTYTLTNILLANILKVGINKDDTVIIAVDRGKSWRKGFDENYKADRKGKREAHKEINWEDSFAKINDLLINLDYATNFHIVGEESLEADDWGSYISRYYNTTECVLISFDSDWEQLLSLPNVKLFSPKSKKYKFNNNPYLLLAKKTEKETSDNLITPVANERDFDKRDLCINLLTLPGFVEDIMKKKLDNLLPKEEHIEDFPFSSLRDKYCNLYNNKTKIVTEEQTMKKKRKKIKK